MTVVDRAADRADERTLERVDPLTAVDGRPITVLGSLTAIGYCVVSTVLHWDEVTNPFLAVAALAVVATVFALVIAITSPLQPPVGRWLHITGLAMLLGAMALSALSRAGAMDRSIQDDWGTIALGLFTVFLCTFRPPLELGAYSIVAAAFAGLIVLAQQPALTDAPALAQLTLALTPMLALSLGGTAFAAVFLRMTMRWRNRAETAAQAQAAQELPGLTRSVQQDLVSIVNRDVVPLFTELLARDAVAVEDQARAGAIGASIRSAMVSEIDRSWLGSAVEVVFGGAIPPSAVDDPDRLAGRMALDQRSAIRALLVALADADPRPDLLIVLERGDGVALGELSAHFDSPSARSRLAPYLAVLRVVFAATDSELSSSSLRVRFEYARD